MTMGKINKILKTLCFSNSRKTKHINIYKKIIKRSIFLDLKFSFSSGIRENINIKIIPDGLGVTKLGFNTLFIRIANNKKNSTSVTNI